MPKYIDVSKIRLTAVGTVDENGDILVSVRDVKKAIEQTPAADVIPKEFLTRKEDEAYERGYAEAKSEVVSEIFEEIDTLVNDWKNNYIQSIQFIAKLADLKKKLAEAQK